MKQEKVFKTMMFCCLFTGIISILIGSAYALFSTNMQGTKVNEISSASLTLTYIEPEMGIDSGIVTDEYGILNNEYFEFTVNVNAEGKAKLDYYIYLKEVAGNNITSDKIKIYVTDENNNPISDDYKELTNGKGNYCYNYTSGEFYPITSDDYYYCDSVLSSLDDGESAYLMNDRYYYSENYSCTKYTKQGDSYLKEFAELNNCSYGYAYKGKAINIDDNNLKYSILGLNKVIYDNSFTFTEAGNETRTYRIKTWANNIEQTLEEEIINGEEHQSTSENLVYRFKINVYAKQVELGE